MNRLSAERTCVTRQSTAGADGLTSAADTIALCAAGEPVKEGVRGLQWAHTGFVPAECVLAKDDGWQHFVLTKFTRPDGNGVTVETCYELTFDWMNGQIARVGDALDSVKARYHELKASS